MLCRSMKKGSARIFLAWGRRGGKDTATDPLFTQDEKGEGGGALRIAQKKKNRTREGKSEEVNLIREERDVIFSFPLIRIMSPTFITV